MGLLGKISEWGNQMDDEQQLCIPKAVENKTQRIRHELEFLVREMEALDEKYDIVKIKRVDQRRFDLTVGSQELTIEYRPITRYRLIRNNPNNYFDYNMVASLIDEIAGIIADTLIATEWGPDQQGRISGNEDDV